MTADPSSRPGRNASRRQSSPYRPEIDGLRAVAVLSVVLFHADLGLPGGFVGVDVFFVISGFLVTGIIRRQLEQQQFSLRNFYLRRLRRIFPAAAFVTAFVLAFGYRSLLPDDLTQVSKASLAQSFFASNVFFWTESGYFTRDVLTKPFLHFWSLAIEEQFYVLFPPLLTLIYKRSPQRLRSTIGGFAIVSFLLAWYGTYRHTSATFYLLPTRAWELLAGSWLALSHHDDDSQRPNRLRAEFLSIVGLSMIVGVMLGIDQSSAFPGWIALLPVIGTMLVIHANTRPTKLVGGLLTNRCFVFIGLISYSLYLWHWPLLAMARYFVIEPSTLLLSTVAFSAIPIAAASWRWIEQPIRNRSWLSNDRRLVAASVCAWSVLVLTSIGLIGSGGIPSRFEDETQALITDATWTGNWASRDTEDIRAGRVPRLGASAQSISGDKSPPGPDFMLWGDSHAMTWVELLDQVGDRLGRSGIACLHGGTPPITGLTRTGMPGCREFNAATLELALEKQVRDIILVSRWSVYVNGYSDQDPKADGRSDADLYLSDQQTAEANPDESLAAMIRQIRRMAQLIATHPTAPRPRLWLVRQVPPQPTRIAEAAIRNHLLGWNANRIAATTRGEYGRQQAKIEEFYIAADDALKFTSGGVVDFSDQFFDNSDVAILRAHNRFLFRDDDHLSRSGAAYLRPAVTSWLRSLESVDTSGKNEFSRYGGKIESGAAKLVRHNR
ncbi:acyltransferase family protein [Roseiconus lacunae]|uniref:acyltransferase family protein n=1 Tax=Roseiconus lacunae TaxID=2605694 RepID=UPI00135C8BE6|nr:acyltransferase family protein [Roseiconus lacunae]